MNTKRRLARWITAASLLAGVAQGDTLTVLGTDYTRGGLVSFKEDGVNIIKFAGVILGSYSGLSVSPLFCVDLFTGIKTGSYDSLPILPRVERNEDRVAWLYVNALPTITSAIAGRALQLAIWDIVHDGGDGFASGRIQSSGFTPGAVLNAWQTFLDNSAGQSLMAGGFSIYRNFEFNGGIEAQAMIGGRASIPEPSMLVLSAIVVAAGLGLLKVQSRVRFQHEENRSSHPTLQA